MFEDENILRSEHNTIFPFLLSDSLLVYKTKKWNSLDDFKTVSENIFTEKIVESNLDNLKEIVDEKDLNFFINSNKLLVIYPDDKSINFFNWIADVHAFIYLRSDEFKEDLEFIKRIIPGPIPLYYNHLFTKDSNYEIIDEVKFDQRYIDLFKKINDDNLELNMKLLTELNSDYDFDPVVYIIVESPSEQKLASNNYCGDAQYMWELNSGNYKSCYDDYKAKIKSGIKYNIYKDHYDKRYDLLKFLVQMYELKHHLHDVDEEILDPNDYLKEKELETQIKYIDYETEALEVFNKLEHDRLEKLTENYKRNVNSIKKFS